MPCDQVQVRQSFTARVEEEEVIGSDHQFMEETCQFITTTTHGSIYSVL